MALSKLQFDASTGFASARQGQKAENALRGFESRSDFAAAIGADAIIELRPGTRVRAGELFYKFEPDSLDIPDLPQFVPDGDVSVTHWFVDPVTRDISTAAQFAEQFVSARGLGKYHIPPGEWRQSGTGITMYDNVEVVGSGMGVSVIRKIPGVNEYHAIYVERVVNGVFQSVKKRTFRDLTLRGNGSAAEPVVVATSLVRCYGSEDMLFERVEACYSRGYGIGLQGMPTRSDPSRKGPHIRTTMLDCDIHHNGRAEYALPNTGGVYDPNGTIDPGDGVDVKYAHGFIAERNRFYENGDDGLDIRAVDVRVSGNEMWANGNAGLSLVTIPAINDDWSSIVSDNYSHDNVASGYAFVGATASPAVPVVTFTGNRAHGNADGVIVSGENNGRIRIAASGNQLNNNTRRGLNVRGSLTEINASATFMDNNGEIGLLFEVAPTVKSAFSACSWKGNGTRPFDLKGKTVIYGGVVDDSGPVPLTTGVNRIEGVDTSQTATVDASGTIRFPEWSNSIYLTYATAAATVNTFEPSWEGRIIVVRVRNGNTIATTAAANMTSAFVSGSSGALISFIYTTGAWREMWRKA